MNVVGDDVGVLGELLVAEGSDTLLAADLPVKQFPHFAVRAEFREFSVDLRN